jgi:hypothetical protein
MRRDPALQPQHALLLGPTAHDAKPRVLTYSMRSGNWLRNRTNLVGLLKVPVVGPVDVTIALNLAGLPDDVLTREHVRRNAEVKVDFAKVTHVDFLSRREAEAKGQLNPLDKNDLVGATHFQQLRIDAMNVDNEIVSIAVRDELPVWIRDMSTDNDLDASAHGAPSKTFGLLPIIGGAARALRNADQRLFEFQLALER